jgi:hypothetical protein
VPRLQLHSLGQHRLQQRQQQPQTHTQVHMPITPQHISREPSQGNISREPRLGRISKEPNLRCISREPRPGHTPMLTMLLPLTKCMLRKLAHMEATLAIQLRAIRKVQCPIILQPMLCLHNPLTVVQQRMSRTCMARLVSLDILLGKFSRAVALQMQRKHLHHHLHRQHHIPAHMTQQEEPRGEIRDVNQMTACHDSLVCP